MIAVLVSGGLDSFVAYHLAVARYGRDNVKGLFVHYDQPYLSKELEATQELFKVDELIEVSAELCSNKLNNIPTVEKQEIWGRNLLLAFYGALVGDRVWLSALENELHHSVPDKHPEFMHMCSALFTYTLKNLRNNTVVESPFYELTKSEVVELGLLLGLTKEQLLQTVSCYDGEKQSCGKCLSCFKRKIAWVNNNIEEEFDVDPFHNDYAKRVIPLMRQGDKHYSRKRLVETHNALIKSNMNGILGSINLTYESEPELIQWARHEKEDWVDGERID